MREQDGSSHGDGAILRTLHTADTADTADTSRCHTADTRVTTGHCSDTAPTINHYFVCASFIRAAAAMLASPSEIL